MINFIKAAILLGFLCIKSQLIAQDVITGVVKNNKQIPIENVSIVIKNIEGAIMAYTYTNESGFFLIENTLETNTKFELIAISLGYKEYAINFNNEIGKKPENFNIILSEKPFELNEVVLTPDQKISSNSNTTTLKTKYFTDDSEQTVEDVLKKLPGVEVLEDGTIKAHGKFISKLLIEGDDVFGNNYQILTKNLDAKSLNAVDIIDRFQDNPVLAKVMDSDMVALNLKLKEGFKNIWFGNTTLGLGTQERIKLELNLGLLRKKIKFFYFSNYNNLGIKASSLLDGAPASLNLSAFYQEQRIEENVEPIYNIEKNESNLFTKGESTFNKAFMNSLGFVKKLTPNIELRGTGAFSRDNQNQQFFAKTLFNVNATPIQITEHSNTNHINKIGLGELELKYTGGNRSYLKNIFAYNNQPEHLKNNITFNSSDILQNLKQNQFSFYNHFNHSYALSRNNVLNNYIYLGKNKIRQHINLQSPVFNNLFTFPTDYNVNYITNSSANILGLSSILLSKFNNFKTTTKLEYKFLNEKQTNTFPDETTLDSLQNNLIYKTNALKIKSSLSYAPSKKVNLSLGASLNHVKIDIDNKQKEHWFFIPELRLDLSKLNIGLLRVRYANTFNLPKSSYFINNYQLNSFRSFTRGTNRVELVKNKKISIHYKLANKLESQALSIQVQHAAADKNYSTTNNIGTDVIYSSYNIFNGFSNFKCHVDFTSYYEKLNLSTNFRTNQTWATTPFQVNNQETQNLKNHLSSYLISGTTYFKFPLNFNFKINLNKNNSKFNNVSSISRWENMALNLTYAINKTCKFALNNDYYITDNNAYYFLNTKLTYQPKDSDFSYQIIANNLSNQKTFSNIVVNDYTTYNSSINLLPRYILATLKYRF